MEEIKYNLTDDKAIELLKFLVENGKVDVGNAEKEMKRSQMIKVLAAHPYKIYQAKDGRWVTYVIDEEKPNNRRKVVKPTREDLEEELYRFYVGEEKKQMNDRMTLQDIYPDWLAYKELHTSASSTTLRIDSDWKRFYKDTKIAKMPLRRLTKVVLDEWVHSMIKQYEMDKTMYYNFSGIIRQCLDYAVDKEIINENNFRKVRVDGRRMFKKKKKKSSESQVYSKEELKGLMELAWKDYYERTKVYQLAPLAVMMQFETGVRIGEVCVLRYEDIDGSYLHVRRMLRRDCRQVVDHTKGGHEDRVVILTSDARNIIDKCRERQLELGVDSDGYIFSVDGNYCSYGAIADLYRKYCNKLGIQMKSSHKSRKTFISTLLDANMNANTVREMVGHADERTTLQSYHFDRSTEDERVLKMEEALKLEDD